MTLLSASEQPLHAAHDTVLLDLDGVVYLSKYPVPGAVEALTAVSRSGARLAYLTNNASRAASTVADHLRDLGLPNVADGDVVTSAQAIASVLAHDLPAGSAVLVVGGAGLRDCVTGAGLRPVDSLADGPAAVVQGYDAKLGWSHLAEASYAIESGLPWYVSNTDETIPTARGVAPGNGTLVAAVRTATGADPTAIAGKPYAPLFDETMKRLSPQSPLMVGDRLDTDILGASNAGIASLAVLTGVSTAQDIADADGGLRPSFVAPDLSALLRPHLPVVVDGEAATCGDAVVVQENDRISVQSAGDALDRLRAAIGLAWSIRDATGRQLVLDGTIGA